MRCGKTEYKPPETREFAASLLKLFGLILRRNAVSDIGRLAKTSPKGMNAEPACS
jgi:hypothetical protein